MKRPLIEEEQRQRVRVAAIALEEILEARGDDDPDPLGTSVELTDVRKVIALLGRTSPYSEQLAVDTHRERLQTIADLADQKGTTVAAIVLGPACSRCKGPLPDDPICDLCPECYA